MNEYSVGILASGGGTAFGVFIKAWSSGAAVSSCSGSFSKIKRLLDDLLRSSEVISMLLENALRKLSSCSSSSSGLDPVSGISTRRWEAGIQRRLELKHLIKFSPSHLGGMLKPRVAWRPRFSESLPRTVPPGLTHWQLTAAETQADRKDGDGTLEVRAGTAWHDAGSWQSGTLSSRATMNSYMYEFIRVTGMPVQSR